ncbi:hypothetical protein [Lactobacillus phage S193]|nr:hypothetical protein [Lactobacillus phage S193]
MALVVVNMGIIFAIFYVIWTISIIAYVYSNYKNKKSNQDLSEEIHKSNDLNDQLLETVKNIAIQLNANRQLRII